MNCYNCGAKLSSDSKIDKIDSNNDVLRNHGEHVPAKCLFNDANDEQKMNRIKVPACFSCNNGFSGIDDELRNILGVTNMEVASETTNKTIRVFERKNNYSEQFVLNELGNLEAVKFSLDPVNKSCEKNFKALMYHEYGVLAYNFEILVDIRGDRINNNVEMPNIQFNLLYHFLIQNGDWKCSGHRDIFEYLILPTSIDENKNLVKENNISNASQYIMLQVYHQKMTALLIGGKISNT